MLQKVECMKDIIRCHLIAYSAAKKVGINIHKEVQIQIQILPTQAGISFRTEVQTNT